MSHLAIPGYSRRESQEGPTNLAVHGPETTIRDLQRLGELIFSHLLTEPARKKLRTAAPGDLYLRLDDQLIHVPWELCCDGQDFLATKFRVGRQVITAAPIPEARTKRVDSTALSVLLIADPTETLPDASHEAEQLCILLDEIPGVAVTLLGGKGLRKIPLLATLPDHDIVHFAGHSYYDPQNPSHSGWRLHDSVVTAGELSKLSRSPLLVFSNSCQAGSTAEWAKGYRYEGQAFGIGSAFLLAGVQNYIGTFWVVHDEESVVFARVFYQSVALGLSLGEALQQARQTVIEQRGWASLTWASYMLYGDPRVVLLSTAEDQQPPAGGGVQATLPSEHREALVGTDAPEPYQVSVEAPTENQPQHIGPAQQLRKVESIQVVGRETELNRLERCFERARNGERQVVFVTGEPGIGKTTVVEAFLASITVGEKLWIGHGQCIEHYGAGEAYLPVLEAWSRLCQAPGNAQLIARLRQYAPTWLVQLPALINEVEFTALQRKLQGTARERMLREMAELIEVLTAEVGCVLILVLEDLHWSDVSTLELIGYLAQRRELTRLLVIGTYRPAEALVSEHPLKRVVQELQGRGRCEELQLAPLQEKAVEEYLTRKLAGYPLSVELARVIHRRTEGNPLFIVNMVEHLLRQGVLIEESGQWTLKDGFQAIERELPENLRRLIEKQIEELGEEETRLIEVASVVGTEVAVAAVAAGLEKEVDEVEERCEGLARKGRFLCVNDVEEWPDGTLSGRYSFIHALYQDVVYNRIAAARQIRLHKRIGERKEAAYGERAAEIAGELAAHFEQGRDYQKAVQYLGQAGANAVRRSAYQEAIGQVTKGLAFLQTLADTPECTQQELQLQLTLGGSLIATQGYAAPEVERVYARARELCEQVGGTPRLFPILWGLFGFYLVRADFQTARELGEQLLRLAQNAQSPTLRLEASFALGQLSFHLGELAAARTHLEQGIALYDSQQYRHDAFQTMQDTGVSTLSYVAYALWVLGYPDQALKRTHEMLVLAQKLAQPLSLAWAFNYAAGLHRFRGEQQAVQEQAEAAVALAAEQGLPFWMVMGTVQQGWALAEQGQTEEGVTQIRQGLAAWRSMGAELGWPSLSILLVEACGKAGRTEEGLAMLTEALAAAHKTGESWYVAELYRLYGELSLRIGETETGRTGDKTLLPDSPILRFPVSAPEECFTKAIEIARRQGAKSLELRAATSLSRLWQQQGRAAEARQLLAEIYEWFTEGFDTADLKEAKALLEELALSQS